MTSTAIFHPTRQRVLAGPKWRHAPKSTNRCNLVPGAPLLARPLRKSLTKRAKRRRFAFIQRDTSQNHHFYLLLSSLGHRYRKQPTPYRHHAASWLCRTHCSISHPLPSTSRTFPFLRYVMVISDCWWAFIDSGDLRRTDTARTFRCPNSVVRCLLRAASICSSIINAEPRRYINMAVAGRRISTSDGCIERTPARPTASFGLTFTGLSSECVPCNDF